MKARPRSVENRVADHLNGFFQPMGFSPVERIPVLGRTGPDLTINELNLVVDVKSRREVPKTLFFPLVGPFAFDYDGPHAPLYGVRLDHIYTLWDPEWMPALVSFSSKLVRGYLDHMQEWTQKERPEGVSCVILHRPEMPVGSSVAIIYSYSRRRLFAYAEQRNNPIPAE